MTINKLKSNATLLECHQTKNSAANVTNVRCEEFHGAGIPPGLENGPLDKLAKSLKGTLKRERAYDDNVTRIGAL